MAQGLQRRAVTLCARQEPFRPLRVDAVLALHLRVHLEARRADWRVAIRGHRAAEIPVDTDVDVDRLELDSHVRGDRAEGALLADGQCAGQAVARARGV